jgi:hypothetical protein
VRRRVAWCGNSRGGRGARSGDMWGGRGAWRGDTWSGRSVRGRGRVRRGRRVRCGSCRAAVPASWLLRLCRARRRRGSADDEQSRDANIVLEHGTTSCVVRRQLTSELARGFRTARRTRARNSMTNCSESPHLTRN